MSNTKKLSDMLTWVNHGERFVEGMNGNLVPHVKEAYRLIRDAVKKEMVDLPELDGLVKSMKQMQQNGTNPYNGYEQSVLIDRYRELKQALWVQRCDYLAALKAVEHTLSDKLSELLRLEAGNWQTVTSVRTELDAVRDKISGVEEQKENVFFKQRMIKEAVLLNKFYAGEKI
jgi:hypothetical protein